MTHTSRSVRAFASGLLATALAAIAGCATDQAGDVASYQKITDITPAPPTHTAGEALTLVEAVQLANTYNERLAIEGESYIQALADRQRRASLLIPTLDVFGDLNLREHTGGAAGVGQTGGTTRIARFDGGFSGQYTLLTGLTDFKSVESAESNIRARYWLLLDLRETLMLETARAYYEVLRAERLLEVLESSMRVQAERLRDIRGRQQVGFARPLDVAQIEAQVSDTRVTILDAHNAIDRSRAALKLLTAADITLSPLTDGYEIGPSPESLEPAVTLANSHRQDMLAARSSADAARLQVDAAIGLYYPSIAINANYFLTRDTTPTDLDLTSLISINLPIFSAGRIEAQVRDSWSVFRETVLNYSLTRRSVRRDVETALADHGASRQRVVELRTQVAAAQEALRQASAAYQAGLGTNLEWIEAQDQLLSSQLRAASEDFTLKLTYLSLLRACGTLSADLARATFPEAAPRELTPPESPFLRIPPGRSTDDPAWTTPSTPSGG